MDQDFEAPTHSHTGLAFMELVYDLLDYAMPKWGYEWPPLQNCDRIHKKIFKESFGYAILLFRSRHVKEFEERLSTYFETVSDYNIVKYSWHFCERTLKGKTPLMELIAYLAFVLDTSLYYTMIGEIYQVHLLVNETIAQFQFAEEFFPIVGGWHALYQVADQYVYFVNGIPSAISSAPASNDASALKL